MTTAAYTTRSILGTDRRTGQFVALVPSSSEPGKFHITTATTCSCKSFTYRARCRHLPPAPEAQPARSRLVRYA